MGNVMSKPIPIPIRKEDGTIDDIPNQIVTDWGGLEGETLQKMMRAEQSLLKKLRKKKRKEKIERTGDVWSTKEWT